MKRMINNPDDLIAYREYLNRELSFRHHSYEREMRQYELMRAGDAAAVEESRMMFSSASKGSLSKDALRNIKYLFVASATLVTRFAIAGGLNPETAYNASDLYINRMDECLTEDEVRILHSEMFEYFTRQMAGVGRRDSYSRPVLMAMEFIDGRLQDHIRIAEVAEYAGLNPSYLSTLFRKETGMTLSGYIMERKMDSAKNMLKYSSFPASEISAILGFSSQSHFIRSFKSLVGCTPGEFRRTHYREEFFPEKENSKAAGAEARSAAEAMDE
ncbi:MAG: helix-turn-helix domain-containing protein [Firmicutes bacterium]|nr:helix-turn-helix domain-containing protein [Bacillota bacterium]